VNDQDRTRLVLVDGREALGVILFQPGDTPDEVVMDVQSKTLSADQLGLYALGAGVVLLQKAGRSRREIVSAMRHELDAAGLAPKVSDDTRSAG